MDTELDNEQQDAAEAALMASLPNRAIETLFSTLVSPAKDAAKQRNEGCGHESENTFEILL